jgi:hypothetical protein
MNWFLNGSFLEILKISVEDSCEVGVYWTQNICGPELHHSKRGKEGEKGKGRARRLMRYASPPSPYLGWPPTCVIVTVNKARRYLATSIIQ